jgi:hypothetical protein
VRVGICDFKKGGLRFAGWGESGDFTTLTVHWYRSLGLKQMPQMKKRIFALLMKTGVSYNHQRRLHKLSSFMECRAMKK